MASLGFGVNFNGTQPDEEDRRAMNWLIDEVNIDRAANGLPLMPKAIAAERNASYQQLMAERMLALHLEFINQAGEKILLKDLSPRFRISNDAQRAAALAALAPLP